MARFLNGLRSGAWLTWPRLVAYLRLLLATYAILILVGLLTATGPMDALRRPLGTDFSQVWAAGVAVLAGHPEQPFDPALHAAAQRALFAPDTLFYGWHYPPYFLAVAALLALLPYIPALLIWQGTTFAVYLLVVRRILPHPLTLLVAAAFPAVLVNVGHGHNGFLTASLLGGGLLLLDRRPVLAGVLLGLLVYKPQFGLVLPLALLAGRRWTVIGSAAGTVVLMTLATLAAFGAEPWRAFRSSLAFTRTVVLEEGNTGWEKIQSAFSAVRALGAGVSTAYAIQGVLTGTVMLALTWLWYGRADIRLKSAALITATLLSTPYVLDYDMVVLGPALAFAVSWELARGVRPWMASLLTAVWVAPLLTRTIAAATHVPLGLIVMVAFFAATIRGALPVSFRSAIRT
jgi:alpha-1,2-mannosyltransferase